MPNSLGIHHIHKRKRISQKLLPYPHKNKWIRFLDKFLLIIAVIGPLMAFPQVFKIYIEKNASGVSLLSWSLFTLLNIPWIIYGFVHKEKPIIIAYCLWFIINLIISIGIIVYS